MTTSAPSPAEKLAELLESASPEVRREITAWLLDSHRPATDAIGVPWLPPPFTPPAQRHPPFASELAGSLPAGTDSQVVTLRLPAPRHARLRDWCAAHGFSMAAVVRGLVERFLEEQAAT